MNISKSVMDDLNKMDGIDVEAELLRFLSDEIRLKVLNHGIIGTLEFDL